MTFYTGVYIISVFVLLVIIISCAALKDRDILTKFNILSSALLLVVMIIYFLLENFGIHNSGDFAIYLISWILSFISAVLMAIISVKLASGKNSGAVLKKLCIVFIPILPAFIFDIINKGLFMIPPALSLSALTTYILCSDKRYEKHGKTAKEMMAKGMWEYSEIMRPSFISDTLRAIINSFDEEGAEPSKALEMLSGYLECNLSSLEEEHTIPFTQELKHIEQYAGLEKINLKGNITFTFDTAFLYFDLPPLSIERLVENAVNNVRSLEENRTVKLSTLKKGGYIEISVEDNGPKSIAKYPAKNLIPLKEECNALTDIRFTGKGNLSIILIPFVRR